jgi:two-component system chemotaxis response regulator CheY
MVYGVHLYKVGKLGKGDAAGVGRRRVLDGMEVFTGNDQKDSQMTFEISPNSAGLQELSPSMILLVDDDPDIRSLSRTFLEHEGYSVFTSGDAERAVQIFRSVPQIDLLVTDLHMPGQSGLELGMELRELRSDLPVLLISGGAGADEYVAQTPRDGWNFMAKPFRLPELLATVHRILAPVEARRWRKAKQGVSADGLLTRR